MQAAPTLPAYCASLNAGIAAIAVAVLVLAVGLMWFELKRRRDVPEGARTERLLAWVAIPTLAWLGILYLILGCPGAGGVL
jgi:hypothetical protein